MYAYIEVRVIRLIRFIIRMNINIHERCQFTGLSGLLAPDGHSSHSYFSIFKTSSPVHPRHANITRVIRVIRAMVPKSYKIDMML